MPTYKLTYFNAKSRGETARMLFKLAKVDFEDCRVEREKWPELKPKTPMGVLPVLEVDGKQLCQSNTINRYLAREFGYGGTSAWAQATVDMIVDSLEDLTHPLKAIFAVQNDAEKKAAAAKKYREETLEPAFTKLEALLKQNKGGNEYFVGSEITVADITFINTGGFALTLSQGDLSKFPKLQALKKKVESNPKIAAWIKARPDTAM